MTIIKHSEIPNELLIKWLNGNFNIEEITKEVVEEYLNPQYN